MTQKTFDYKYASHLWDGFLSGEVYKFPNYAPAKDKIVVVDYLSVKIIPRVVEAKLIIVNNYVGPLSHALILSREFNIPVIIGTEDFKRTINGQKISINIKEKIYIEE